MIKYGVMVLLAWLCAVVAAPAEAFVDPPYLTPEAPREGDVVSVNIRHGGCDHFVALPGFPVITQNGNAINIRFFGYKYVDTELCYWEPWTITGVIGTLPPGTYTLQVDWLFGGMGDYQTVTLDIIPFTVAAAQATAAPVPVGDPMGLLLLASILTIFAAWALHIRGADRSRSRR